MKTVFNFSLAAALLASVAVARADEDPLARVAALVDYVAADYPGAVRDGKVISPSEWEEQRGMVRDAGALAAKIAERPGKGEVVAGVQQIARLIDDKRSPDEVAVACRAVREVLVGKLGLVLVPQAAPSRERARKLFDENCAACHGRDGRADTDAARALKPPPVSFRDAERMGRISPQLAYHALTFGVKDTAMAPFDRLPPSDRWSLAFYVVALRHDGDDAKAGARAFADAKPNLTATAAGLSALSDRELDQQLAGPLPDGSRRAQAIAWLRRDATFAAGPGGTFADARRLLGEVAAAPPERRHDLVVSAYLDGIEPHEATLRAHDPGLCDRVENAFLDLRRAVDAGSSGDELQKKIAAATLLLDRAEEHEAGPEVAFLAAMTIALREGLEAALLIAALLAFLRKSGRERSARLVHLGWIVAAAFGAITWFIAGAVVGGAKRELVEAVMTLLAAVTILAVSHWVLGREEAKHWVGFLRKRVMADQGAWPLFLLAFVAAYREAFEVVLFYRALLLDMAGQSTPIALGAAAGAVGMFAVVFIVSRLGRKLNPRPVMLASSVLLAALAVALVGRGVRALQEGGYVGLTPVAFPDLSTVGIYPSLQGLIAQAVMVAAIFAPSVVERLRRRAAVDVEKSTT